MSDGANKTEVGLKFAKLAGSFVISAAALTYLVPLIFDPSIDDGTKKWLTGVVGMLLGYWVK